MSEYLPIDCGLHSELELAILHRLRLDIETRDGERLSAWRGEDLRVRDHAEYLCLRGKAGERREIRLDELAWVRDSLSGRIVLSASEGKAQVVDDS